MKYIGLLFMALLFSACGGDNDFLSIDEYLEQTGIETEVTASGLHYIINESGDAEKPELSSNINITYDGYFLGGESFDGGNDVTFPLQNLILGWQEGIRLIGRGGDITLFIPSQFAYGQRGQGPIPPNTDIGFDITLHDFE